MCGLYADWGRRRQTDTKYHQMSLQQARLSKSGLRKGALMVNAVGDPDHMPLGEGVTRCLLKE